MTEFERPELYWNGEFHDVLSGGFVAKTDTQDRVHTLSRLFIAAWSKGEEVEQHVDYRKVAGGMGKLLAVQYEPSWGGGSSVVAIARAESRVLQFSFAAGMILTPPEGYDIPELRVGFNPEGQELTGEIETAPLDLTSLGVERITTIGYDLARRAGNFYQAVQANGN